MGLGSKGGFGLGGWAFVAGLAAGAAYLHKKHKDAQRERAYAAGLNSDQDYSNLDFDPTYGNDDQPSMESQPPSEEELEEIRRKNTPFHFDNGFTSNEFEEIVERCAHKILSIGSVEVDGPIVYCRVISARDASDWCFKLDFNDYGHYTGTCWITYENDGSTIPNRLIELIRDEIAKLNSNKEEETNNNQFCDSDDTQNLSEEEIADNRRKNTPFNFDSGISSNEFVSIAERCAYTISAICSLKVVGPIVYCKVSATRGNGTWNFRIDFNDYGHLTGNWWTYYEGDDSEIPVRLANLISDEINKIKYDFDNLSKIDLQFKKDDDGNVILRVNTKRNASYLWQVRHSNISDWTDLEKTNSNTYYLFYSSMSIGNEYRCIVFSNERAVCRSSVYVFDGKTEEPNNDYDSLPKINLQYKLEKNGMLTLRVNTNALSTCLWQIKRKNNGEWDNLQKPNSNQISLERSSFTLGDRIRCVVFCGNKPTYCSKEYLFVEDNSKSGASNNYEKLTRINLQYKEENTGRIGLRVKQFDNATYLWQVRKHGNGEWEELITTDKNTYHTTYSSYRIGNQYRCIVFIGDRPAYRSSIYEIGGRNNTEQDNSQKKQNTYNEENQSKQEETVYSSIFFFEGCNSWDEVKKRYRKLMKEYHPDTAAGDAKKAHQFEAAAKKINEQYDEQKIKYGRK